MRATPPSARMSAGTRSSAMTAQAPAVSAIFACSASTTSIMTPPLSISARPVLTRRVPVSLTFLSVVVAMFVSASVGSSATGASPLRGATIAVDPGHNGRNWAHPAEINRLVDAGTLRKACDTTGTATASGYAEPAFTFDVAVRLRRILRQAGATVVLTRPSNAGWGPCITERAAIGNRARADAAVSIHADGGPPSGRGFHVIYPPSIRGLTDDIAKPSSCLALAMRRAYRAGTGLPYATYLGGNGLSVRSDLGGLNLSDVPKVFVETGNMRNRGDAAQLESPRFRERIARSIAAGLARFLSRC